MLIFRRRNWLIDSEIQVGLGVRLALCLTAYTALFLVVSLADPISTLFSSKASPMATQAARWELHRFITSTIGPLFLATACMVLHSVLILHRLAGPVLRVRRGLGDIGKRDLTGKIKLRKRDLLKSVVMKHNDALDSLKEDVSALSGEVGSLEQLLSDDTEMDEELRQKLRAHLERAAGVLGRYRLDRSAAEPVESQQSTGVPAGA